MAGTDFSHLTNDELIQGIKILKLPEYIRSKAYGVDVRETLAQMTEMLMQLAYNQGMDIEQAQEWARQIAKIDGKADQSFVDSQLSAIVSGAPKGTFTDLTALQNAYPNGTDGVFLVLQNGHWYYWDDTSSTWADGGVYQASGIADGAITPSKLSPEIVDVIELNNIIKNPDFSNLNTLSRPLHWGVILGDNPSANGVMNFTATGAAGNVYQNLTVTTGHKYFAHVEVSGTATGYVDYYDANSIKLADLNTDGVFNEYEGVFTATNNTVQRFRIVNTSGSGILKIKKPVLIDLTAKFGAGNEPNLTEMSKIYEQSSTSDSKTYTFAKLNSSMLPEIGFEKPLKVSIAMNKIGFSFNYAPNDRINFVMAKKGPNSIFDFSTIKTSSGNLSYQNSSDFFGPYIVKALNNADGDNITSGYFTGGNHGYQNSGTIGGANTPTGRTASLDFYVDNLKVDDFDGYANIIKIVWTNYIQGYNTTKTNGTGREILKETYSLEITEQGIEVHNDIEPLEDLVIERYYGLQAQKGAWDNWYRFEGASNRKRNPWSVASDSGDYGTTKIFSGNDVGDILEISLSNNIDLGELELATMGHNAFTSPTKAYFRLIDNSPTLTTGDIYSFEGRYRFYKI